MAASMSSNSHTHDRVTYHQYVTELTYLLFLKMAKETGQEQRIPEEWRRDELEALDGTRHLTAGAGDLCQRQLVHQEAGDAQQAGERDRQARLVQRPPGRAG